MNAPRLVPKLVEELRGVGAGSGAKFEDLMAMSLQEKGGKGEILLVSTTDEKSGFWEQVTWCPQFLFEHLEPSTKLDAFGTQRTVPVRAWPSATQTVRAPRRRVWGPQSPAGGPRTG